MNQDISNGAQVGILIELGSPFNTDQQLKSAECTAERSIEKKSTTEEISTTDNTSGTSSESSEKKDENIIEPETEVNQELRWSEDIPLVENEQFDFDLSLSPNCTNDEDLQEEEDEVFFGPVNHREKCVRAGKEIDSVKPLSPLTNEQYAELFKEAIGLVMDLQQDDTKTKQKKTSGETEEFISKTLETLKLSSQYESSPELPIDYGNKTAITETKCFKREQKKMIRSPRRQTYVVNRNPEAELPKASECVSKMKPGNNVVFKAKGAVQQHIHKPLPKKKNVLKSNLLPNKPVSKKKQEASKPVISKQFLRTSPPKRTRKSSVCSDDSFSDTSSIMSDMSEASTSSIPIPGRKRSLPVPKLKKSGLAMPTRTASERTNASKVPSNKPTLMKPGTFQRRTLTVSRSVKTDSTTKGQQQPLKATMSLKSTKKTTPNNSKTQPGTKDRTKMIGKTPEPSISRCPQLKKGSLSTTLPATPVFQEKRVVPKRIISSSSKSDALKKSTSSTSSPTSAMSLRTTPSTPSVTVRPKGSASTTGSARRRSGIPTPMRSTTKSRFSFNNVPPPSPLPMRMSQSSTSSSVSDSPVSPDVIQERAAFTRKQEQSASPVCTHVIEKKGNEEQAQDPQPPATGDLNPVMLEITSKLEHLDSPVFENKAEKNDKRHLFAASGNAKQQLKCDVKLSPAKTPVLIDLNDSKSSQVSPNVANLIKFGDTPEAKELMKTLPVSEKENLLIVI
ncbi:uncharacterized protein [Antedon mediterranea]|uniref:uncharacterized protein n=1 Tax=Antedon mediterranea TaxID=105859 RepID=UPI003AF5B48E